MYTIGDKMVYPLHGAGVIEAIEEKEVLGEISSYYIMRLSYNNMRVIFPVSSNAADSVRDVISSDEADKVIEHFKEFHEEFISNWNRRYRNNIVHIKSGNIYEVAQVVKMLMLRDKTKGLSSGERKMFANAKQILISELVLAKNVSQEYIENMLSSIVDELIENQPV